MAYSPYPNANGAEENPCVCVSNDVIHWVTPDGLYNPIAFNEETACDELKDPHIVIIVIWTGWRFGISDALIPRSRTAAH